MVKFSDIKEVYNQQQEFFKHDESLSRELLATLPVDNTNHALVISGIRRCGKSTLMRQHVGPTIFLGQDRYIIYSYGDVSQIEVAASTPSVT